MDDSQRGQWKLHKLANVIVLLDRNSGGELIEKPDDAENFSLNRKHPLKLMYDALVTVSPAVLSVDICAKCSCPDWASLIKCSLIRSHYTSCT